MNELSTLGAVLRTNARERADAAAIIFDDRCITFAEHFMRAETLAAALLKTGARKGDRISILARNSVRYLDFYAACDLTGLIAVPLNFRLALPELGWIIDNICPSAILYDADFRGTVENMQTTHSEVRQWLEIDNGDSLPPTSVTTGYSNRAETEPQTIVEPGDLASIIYTSGTTGRPKGAMLSHRSLISTARTIASDGDLDAGDKGLIVQPLFHVGARFLQLAHHIVGASIYLERDFEPVRIWPDLREKGITSLQLAPTMIEMLLAERPPEPVHPSLTSIFYSTAPIRESLLRAAILEFGDVFVQHYGSTESGVATTLAKHEHVSDSEAVRQNRLCSAGKPGAGIDVIVVDENDDPVSVGDAGEICVRSDALFSGYWRDRQATEEAMLLGFLRTGDIGYFDDEGYLYIVDRKKDMIITGGENVYPREVENVLLRHPAIAECAVIGAPDDRWGERVVAEVIVRPDNKVTDEELVKHCRENLASYKKPTRIVFRKSLPRLSTGKIDKVSIRKAYWHNQSRVV